MPETLPSGGDKIGKTHEILRYGSEEAQYRVARPPDSGGATFDSFVSFVAFISFICLDFKFGGAIVVDAPSEMFVLVGKTAGL